MGAIIMWACSWGPIIGNMTKLILIATEESY